MRISGFTMGKNAHKLYYPMKQAIMSVRDGKVIERGQ